jgi:hypothetical protein
LAEKDRKIFALGGNWSRVGNDCSRIRIRRMTVFISTPHFESGFVVLFLKDPQWTLLVCRPIQRAKTVAMSIRFDPLDRAVN